MNTVCFQQIYNWTCRPMYNITLTFIFLTLMIIFHIIRTPPWSKHIRRLLIFRRGLPTKKHFGPFASWRPCGNWFTRFMRPDVLLLLCRCIDFLDNLKAFSWTFCLPRLLVSKVCCVVTIHLGIESDVSFRDISWCESHHMCLFNIHYGYSTASMRFILLLHLVISRP